MQEFTGKVVYISDKQTFERVSRPNLTKVMVGVSGDDGQLVFFEARDLAIIPLDRENIKVDGYVQVNYTFKGSLKGVVIYNNIIVNNLVRLRTKNTE